MKLSAKELIETLKPYEEVMGDEYISIIENVTDSVSPAPDLSNYVEKAEFDAIKGKYDDLKTKYIQRFESGEVEVPELPPEPKEEKQITIDDLFVST